MRIFHVSIPTTSILVPIYCFTVCCLTFVREPAFAQNSGPTVRQHWRRVEIPDHYNQFVLPISIKAMCVDRDGNTFTAVHIADSSPGANDPDNCPRYFAVDKYDRSGNRPWRHKLPVSMELIRGEAGTDRNGNVYAIEADGEQEQILSYNSEGALRWNYSPIDEGLNWMRPAALAFGKENKLYVAYYDSYASDRLLAFDTSGGEPAGFSACTWNTAWGCRSRVFVIPNGNILTFGNCAGLYSTNGQLLKNLALPDPNYDVAADHQGNSYLLTPTDQGMVLYKFDTNLNIMWQISSSMNRILVDADDNSILFTDAGTSTQFKHAAKLAPDGHLLWSKQWDVEDFDIYASVVDPISNVYFLGWVGSDSLALLQSYGPEGELRWSVPLQLWDTETARFLDKGGVLGEGAPILCADTRGDIHLASGVSTLQFDIDGYPFLSPYSFVAQYTQAKTLIVQDARRNPIPNETFSLIRVHNNRPVYTEDTLGMFTTNSRGQLVLPMAGPNPDLQYLFRQTSLNPEADTLRVGDTLKIARLVYTEPAVRHAGILGTMYSVNLDNADFLADGRMVFDTVELGSIQPITLRHSEYRYNLVASVEWDADLAYLSGLQDEFRQMSNYLYDVSDGQIRLDTVGIYDNKANWIDADVHILANNEFGPVSGFRGITSPTADPIQMPRKWFYPISTCRDSSYRRHPLGIVYPNNYRTIAHEFGHFALGFGDEYRDRLYNELPDKGAPRCQDLPDGNYGFMDAQYVVPYYGPYASEMSSRYRYQNWACRITDQWFSDGQASCWDYLEQTAERTLNGIFVPILRPEQNDSLERITPSGLTYFPGPNDDLNHLDYDVGSLIDFPVTPEPPSANAKSMNVSVAGSPVGGVAVSIFRNSAPPMETVQGRTTDVGHIWALGVDFASDVIVASGHAYNAVGAGGIAAASKQPGITRRWFCAQAQMGSGVSRTGTHATQSPSGDTVTLSLRPVQGDYPMVCSGTLTGSGWEYGMQFERALPQSPQLDLLSNTGESASAAFSVGTGSYGSSVAENLAVSGSAMVWGVDDSASGFFFQTPYAIIDVASSTQIGKLVGPGGDVMIHLDTANSSVQRAMILSSEYPPMLNGLALGTVQAGRTHSLSVLTGETFVGQNSIHLSYSPEDLKDATGTVMGSESALRVYRWNPGASQWELIGGQVDTSKDIVTATISRSGVYGAFTPYGGLSCCVGKRGNVNCSGIVDLGDLSALVNYLTGAGFTVCCQEAANVNGAGIVDLGDLSALVSYLTGAGFLLPSCP